jgi:hypothetical protein
MLKIVANERFLLRFHLHNFLDEFLQKELSFTYFLVGLLQKESFFMSTNKISTLQLFLPLCKRPHQGYAQLFPQFVATICRPLVCDFLFSDFYTLQQGSQISWNSRNLPEFVQKFLKIFFNFVGIFWSFVKNLSRVPGILKTHLGTLHYRTRMEI